LLNSDFLYMLYYINWFAYIKPFFHYWNVFNLAMMYDIFNVFLKFSLQVFY
jgi:hypothetical protein